LQTQQAAEAARVARAAAEEDVDAEEVEEVQDVEEVSVGERLEGIGALLQAEEASGEVAWEEVGGAGEEMVEEEVVVEKEEVVAVEEEVVAVGTTEKEGQLSNKSGIQKEDQLGMRAGISAAPTISKDLSSTPQTVSCKSSVPGEKRLVCFLRRAWGLMSSFQSRV